MKMAKALGLPLLFHSCSLRRTGATLLATECRTEEQIKVMGNWTSSAAASRYIDNSEVCLMQNAHAVSRSHYIYSSVLDLEEKLAPATASSAAISDSTLDVVRLKAYNSSDEEEASISPPQYKKRAYDGILFSGSVRTVFILPNGTSVHHLLFKDVPSFYNPKKNDVNHLDYKF